MPAPDQPSRWSVTLLGAFELRERGRLVPLTQREQRLLALLALHGGGPRGYISGELWPESTDARASGSLRAAVWKLERSAPGLVRHDRALIVLGEDVTTDVARLRAGADRVCELARAGCADQAEADQLRAAVDALPDDDLLPGWYDDWALFERTRLQQLRIRALEAAAEALLDKGDAAVAARSAAIAAQLEPLRESAHRTLIRAHLLQGNHHLAVAEYLAFRSRVLGELGVGPTGQMEALVRPVLDRRRPAPPPVRHAEVRRPDTARDNEACDGRPLRRDRDTPA